ncbi:MAG: AbrB/MazE/SpoVT family DNA-binding domain-containing protein [Desulfobacterales bacterium]|nr:AbrB/MazE/SpoVT family DNA-binding domain-containing protein [Desulfobacterales bacterium]
MSKVTAKYQVTVPIKVRKELGIIPGMEVDIAKKGNDFVLIADPVTMIKHKWRGKFAGKTTTMEYMDEVRGKLN